MAVTNQRKLSVLGLLALAPLLLLGYQNCAVDLSKTTPGASVLANCNPDAQTLSDFEAILNSTLQNTGTIGAGKTACGSCHNQSGGDQGAQAVYTVYNGDTTLNPSLVQTNFCAIAARGTTEAHHIADHPLEVSHGGGQYAVSDIQALYDFIHANF